ncbi:MAG: CCA-adding enzyme [Elusimicrobia bacterium]|nr:CCA-adding enzyme [Elusimicrobiota bacterium]
MKKTIHVVGGAVRNRLLGRPILDIDFTLPVNPQPLAEKVAQNLGGTCFTMDMERGIVRVALKNGVHLDFVKWQGKTLAEDLDRRDFSLNAMAVPLGHWITPQWKNHIIDRHNGLSALNKRLMHPLSSRVFKEDPLRLLRIFRIAAELKFNISPGTLRLIKSYAPLIKRPAPERKREEILRLFSTPNAHAQLVLMEKTGLLDEIFPEAKSLRKTAPKHYGKGGVLKHTLDSIKCFEEILADPSWFRGFNDKLKTVLNEKISGHPRMAHCKWGLLLHDIGKPETMKVLKGRLRFFQHEHVGAAKVKKMTPRFRWSSNEVNRYENYVRHHMRAGSLAATGDASDRAIHRYFRDLGEEAVAMLLISLGDHLTYLTSAQRKKRNSPHEKLTLHMLRRFFQQREKVLPPKILTGHDIMRNFKLPPSPLIGALLSDLNEAQAGGKISTKNQALSYLKTRLPWHQQQIS